MSNKRRSTNTGKAKMPVSEHPAGLTSQMKSYDMLPSRLRFILSNFTVSCCAVDVFLKWKEYLASFQAKIDMGLITEESLVDYYADAIIPILKKQAQSEYPAKLWGCKPLIFEDNIRQRKQDTSPTSATPKRRTKYYV